LSPGEGTGVTKVVKKLFTNSVTIQSQIHVYTCILRSISRLLSFVERYIIPGWLSLFLFSIAIYCFTVLVGCNSYAKLRDLKP